MTLRQYIFIFALGTGIAVASWLIVLFNINPATAGVMPFLIFFSTLFIALTGLLTTIGTAVRSVRFQDRPVEEVIVTSLRQGFFLAAAVVLSLFLSSRGVFDWWISIVILLALGGLEMFFQRRHVDKSA